MFRRVTQKPNEIAQQNPNSGRYIADCVIIRECLAVKGDANFESDLMVIGNSNFCKPLKVDQIDEKTNNAGVTIEGVNIKNGMLSGIEVICNPLKVDQIDEKTDNAGVKVDNALIKDGNFFVNCTDQVEVQTNKDQPNGYPSLDSSGKLPISILSAQPLVFKGCWDATANMPTITSGVGNDGDYYIVGVAGSTLVDGNNVWAVGDALVFSTTVGIWKKLPGNGAVTSVNSQTGAVILNLDDINNVAAALPSVGDVLTWNGSSWIPQSVGGSGSFTVVAVAYESSSVSIPTPIVLPSTFNLSFAAANPNTISFMSNGDMTFSIAGTYKVMFGCMCRYNKKGTNTGQLRFRRTSPSPAILRICELNTYMENDQIQNSTFYVGTFTAGTTAKIDIKIDALENPKGFTATQFFICVERIA